MNRSDFMKAMLQRNMEQTEEKRQTQNAMKEYMAKKLIDAKIKREQDDYKFYRDQQAKREENLTKKRSERSELEDPTAKWKTDVKKEAKSEFAEAQYNKLYQKKQQGELSPYEQGQFNILSKKVVGKTPSEEMTPLQRYKQAIAQNNAIEGIRAIFDSAKMNDGMLQVGKDKDGKPRIEPLSKSVITRYLLKNHKNIDITDPEIQSFIDSMIRLNTKRESKKSRWQKILEGFTK